MNAKTPLDKQELLPPFDDYMWVKNGRNLIFPDGTVEEGYSLVRKDKSTAAKPMAKDQQ